LLVLIIVLGLFAVLGRTGVRTHGVSGRALYDLIQFTAIEPHTPAIGTVVDLYALPVGHDQGFVAFGTFHIVLI
jgi:hypothetical protein